MTSEPTTSADRDLSALLIRLPLFDGLTAAEAAGLCADMPLVSHAPEAMLMRQGDVDRSALIIVSGRAAVRVALENGTVEIATLGEGALVGEISLLCGTPRTASVVSVEATRTLRIDAAHLDAWCGRDSRIARNAMRLLAHRLATTVQPVAYFMAAARALREGNFDPRVLSAVRDRSDEIGNFARAFIQMADAIRERETALRRDIQELTIRIDEAKRARQVAEITDTDYFRGLQSRVQALRGRRREPPR